MLKQKEKMLIKNDTKGLEEVIHNEREMFIALRDIEDSRRSIIELFVSRYNIKEKVVNLSRIAELIGGDEGSKLEELRGRINVLINTINRQNEKCAVLLRKSIELTDFSIRLLSGALHSKKTYSKKGIIGNEMTSKKIILDYKA